MGTVGVVLQVVIFTGLLIWIISRFDKKGEMAGCLTILSFGVVPALMIVALGVERGARHDLVGPILSWAGPFRFVVVTANLGALLGSVFWGIRVYQELARRKNAASPGFSAERWLEELIILIWNATIVAIPFAIFGCLWTVTRIGIEWLVKV